MNLGRLPVYRVVYTDLGYVAHVLNVYIDLAWDVFLVSSCVCTGTDVSFHRFVYTDLGYPE